MIATAIALQETSKEAVFDETTVMMASALFHGRHEMSDDEFQKAIFIYSGHISAMATTLATNVLLTESQINEMISTIKEMESMGKDLDNGND
jgi:S-adenosylmethionine:tRNA-ribosyltransferase-isomerase (queuine synthetase)